MVTTNLTTTQRDALLATVSAGQLHRGRDGYGATRQGGPRFHQRSLYALVRLGMLELTDGESTVRATPAGMRAAERLRAQRPDARAAA